MLAAAELDGLKGDARVNLDRLPGDPPEPFDPARLERSGVVVDALLGTGFEGEPREPVRGHRRDHSPGRAGGGLRRPVGRQRHHGRGRGEAVRAAATATFHGSKIGLHVMPGAAHAGEVEAIEIGIPRGAPSGERAGLISERVLDLFPHRPREGSKFSSGVVVVVGGSAGLTGAPTMAARSAQRAGAGYVQVAVPEPAQQAVDLRLLEQMSRASPRGRRPHARGSRGRGGDGGAGRSRGSRAGPRPLGAGARVRPPGGARGPGAAPHRRRRAQRARRRARVARGEGRSYGPHPARGRARPPAGAGLGRGQGAPARPRPRGRRAAAAPWCC